MGCGLAEMLHRLLPEGTKRRSQQVVSQHFRNTRQECSRAIKSALRFGLQLSWSSLLTLNVSRFMDGCKDSHTHRHSPSVRIKQLIITAEQIFKKFNTGEFR
jgi:hypothetical protein